MGLNGYVPPINAKKGNNIVEQFLQYRRKFQQTVAHHPTSSPDWLLNASKGLNDANGGNALGTTNH